MTRHRFPGVVDGWARFDGPAGTLMVDTAIEAMRSYMAAPGAANLGGSFAASAETGAMVDRARHAVGAFLGTTADNVVFGANMTSLTFAFTRASARGWQEGDEIVCSELDHDANVTPWILAAHDRGARVRLAPIDPATGRLSVEAVAACLTDRTRWVAVTGASNLIGSMPDVAGIIGSAHDAGARVFVDAVHLAPHRRIDFAALGCDALVTSSYKWYGPHAGVLALRADLLDTIEPYKVRPAPDAGPRQLETGTPSFEAIAGVEGAVRFLMEMEPAEFDAAERDVFAPLLDGLRSIRGVSVHGPGDMVDRTPTVLFNVVGVHPTDVAAALAGQRVAVWAGDSYAVETARALGLTTSGVGVRAGVVRYTSAADVEQLLRAVDALPIAIAG